jgi:hypothetical protein
LKSFILALSLFASSFLAQTNTSAPIHTTLEAVTPSNTPPVSIDITPPTNAPTGTISVTDTNFIPAHLKWESSIGQWQDVGYAVMQGTNLYHMEKTVLSSNLVAEIVWQKKTNYCVIESHPIREVTRTFIIDQVKRYSQ